MVNLWVWGLNANLLRITGVGMGWGPVSPSHLRSSKSMRLVLVLTTDPSAAADIGPSLSPRLRRQTLTPDGATGKTDTGYHVLRRLSIATNCTEALGLSLTPLRDDSP